LVEDGDGSIYVGTGLDVLRPLDLTKKIPNARDSISEALWADVRRPYADHPGGHLYRYLPSTGDQQVLLPEASCPVEDLGIPVAHNGIYALAINPQTRAMYGISYPEGHLFEYQLAARKFRDLGELHRKVVFHGPERGWRSLPRALVVGDSGRVYTSGEDGFLVYYDPVQDKVQSTGLKIPGEYYPVQAYTGYPVVEYFARDQKGLIYGGSSDGHLFSFDPRAQKLVNLGKPRVSRRLRALTVGRDGRLYMVAGERIEPCRLFAFDPQGGGFQDLGIMAVDRSPYYSWRGYQFDTMVTGADGAVYIGESERRAHLFLYLP
jgi:sugar lactone lactonase YvrE